MKDLWAIQKTEVRRLAGFALDNGHNAACYICPAMFVKNYLIAFFVFTAGQLHGQSFDSLFNRIDGRIPLQKSKELFLHLDKSLYATGEKIWFSGYLLNDGAPADTVRSMHVVLVNDMLQEVISAQEFLLPEGVGNGRLFLPDSLQTGEYSVIAYTDGFARHPTDNGFFRQSIEIVGQKPPLTLMFADAGTSTPDSFFVKARIVREDNEAPVKLAVVDYVLYADGLPVAKAKVRENDLHEFPLGVARAQVFQTLELRGTITEQKSKGKENEIQKKAGFKLPLWWESAATVVLLHPEGDRLTAGRLNRLYFKLFSTSGTAVASRVELMEDGQVVTNASADIYGIGCLHYTPVKNKNYEVRLAGQPAAKLLQHFPSVTESAYALVVSETINSDSFSVALTGPPGDKPLVLVVHNGSEIFTELAVKLNKGKGKLAFSTRDWPPGIAAVCLYDDGAKLVAKKPIELLPAASTTVLVTTDSVTYRALSKVVVRIKVKDKNGNGVKGLFSFACVHQRMLTERWTDIGTFASYEHWTTAPQALPSVAYLNDSIHRQYFFSAGPAPVFDPEKATAPFAGYTAPLYTGRVLTKAKRFTPVEVDVLGPQLLKLTTNSSGYFQLPVQARLGKNGSKILLSVSTKNPERYSLVIDSSNQRLNGMLARQYFCLPAVTKKDDYTVNQKEEMQRSTGKTMQTVVIKATSTVRTFATILTDGTCSDFVCMNGILNCVNHPHCCTEPMNGQEYSMRQGGQMVRVVYRCPYTVKMNPYIKTVQPLLYGDEFVPPDFSVASRTDVAPQILNATTLHWATGILTDENGEATISFYSNDVKGKFTAIVQGVAKEGVVRGETAFSVKD